MGHLDQPKPNFDPIIRLSIKVGPVGEITMAAVCVSGVTGWGHPTPTIKSIAPWAPTRPVPSR